MSNSETALAPMDGQQAARELSRYDRKQHNILAPITLDSAASRLRYQVVTVRLDPNPEHRDCYPAPGGKQLAIAKPGLMRLARALALDMDEEKSGFIRPERCDRCIAQTQAAGGAARDCRDCQYGEDVRFRAVGHIPDATVESGRCTFVATASWELAAERAAIEGEAARRKKTKAYVEQRVQEVKRFRDRRVETTAWHRVIRAACGVPHSLPPERMGLPFVTVRTHVILPPEAIAQRAAEAGAQLYGGAPEPEAPTPAATVEEVPPEPEEAPPPDAGENGQTELPIAEPGDGDPFAGEVVKCDECGGTVENAALAYCQSPEGREEVGDANFCIECGKKARAAQAKPKKKGAKTGAKAS